MPSPKKLTIAAIKTKPSKKKAPFIPMFEGPIEGWVVNGMRSNYFRVERSMTKDDYLQQAYLVFLRVSSRYEVTEPQHLMALFKQAWTNELNDLANKDTRLRAFVAPPTRRDADGEEIEDWSGAGDCEHDGTLAIMLRQAPRDVQQVLSFFLSAPQAVVDQALASHRYKAQGSQRVARLLGLDPSVDVLKKVEQYFSPAHS